MRSIGLDIALLVAGLFCCTYMTHGATVHVTESGAGSQDGSTWDNALPGRLLRSRLSSATSGTDFWVAAGTYKPTTGTDQGLRFRLKSGVGMYGGFPAIGNPDMADRAPDTYPTFLSGDIGVQDVNTDNSQTVIVCSDSDQTAVLDGFTITGGYQTAMGGAMGGGMLNSNSSPTVSNCTFTDNYLNGMGPHGGSHAHGGAMYNNYSSPVITNCTFIANTANDGGAIYNWNSSPTITSCNFEANNTAIPFAGGSGGAIYNTFLSSPIVSSCVFKMNAAGGYGGGIASYDSSAPFITHCLFIENRALLSGRGGGAIRIGGTADTIEHCSFIDNQGDQGGAINCAGSLASIRDCSFSGNAGLYGGALYDYHSSVLTIIDCQFDSNTATYGGAIGLYRSSFAIENCAFEGNQAENGAAIRLGNECTPNISNCTFDANSATASGGALNCGAGSSPELANCTLAGNSATDAGGACFADTDSSPVLVNCILWGNSAGVSGNEIEGLVSIEYCCVQGGYASGSNIITDDPLLGPRGPYGGPVQTFPLLPGSPVIDPAGGSGGTPPTTDARGVTRDAFPDLGAFESQGFVGTVIAGDSQHAMIGNPFATPLRVEVSSAHGEPVAGGIVDFSAPLNGASGTFSASSAIPLGSDGQASAPTFTANMIAGDYVVTAGGNGYDSPAVFTLTNDKYRPTITWDKPADIAYGTPLSEMQLNATASIAGTFAYDPPTGCILPSGSNQVLSVVFTPEDSAKYSQATVSVLITVLNTTPTVISVPSAFPNPSTVGESVTFSVTATDEPGDVLYYLWTFGDGTTANGSTVEHTYSIAGNFVASVTINDANGASTTANCDVRVQAGASFSEDLDTDGDGFADEIETAMGSSSSDGSDTPFGQAYPTSSGPLSSERLAIRLIWRKSGRDSVLLRGLLPVREGYSPEGNMVILNIGGIVRSFALNARGASPRGKDQFRIRIKRRKGIVQARLSRFSAKCRHGAFGDLLQDEGLLNTDIEAHALIVPVTVVFDGQVLMGEQPVTYTSKLNRRGIAKSTGSQKAASR